MRRVAYVCTDPGIPAFGSKGASAHLQSVLRVLVRHGVQVDLVCARTGGPPPPDLAGVRVHLLPAVRGEDPAAREESARASDAAVPEVLDALHHDRPLDLVLERYSLWGRSGTRWAARRGVRSVLEVNAPLPEEQAEHRHLVGRREADEVAAAALGTATAAVCVTDAVADWARRTTPAPDRVHVVANGVDTRAVRPASADVVPATGPFTLGFVGTLKPWHGVDVLVEATARLVAADPDHRLLLVGSGPGAEPIARRCEELGIADHVEATGSVLPCEVPALLQRMDLAVAPYPSGRDCYFSPLKVYEYLAAGLPVVASSAGVLPTLLDHGRLGTLVPPGDVDALVDAVTALRADPGRRRRLRRAAVTAAAGHDWSLVVGRVLAHVGLVLPEEVGDGRPQADHVA